MLNYAAGTPTTGYNLTRSLRFRSSASAYLQKTPAGTTNATTYTFSTWFKRGALSQANSSTLLSATFGNLTSNRFICWLRNTDDLQVTDINTTQTLNLVTNQVFRDPSAWYHLVVAIDTTQATASNRVKIYINGTQITSFSTATYPAQNYATRINQALTPMALGVETSSSSYFDGYQAEVNFIDGQALTPSSFGSTNSTTGVWQPARYTGTYGTNGFYLPFTDNSALTTSSNVGLGKDFSGNGNYWTTNNISITAGATYDSMTDVPTLTSATVANYAVLNPLDAANSLINANLTATNNGSSHLACRNSIQIPSTGLFYVEGIVNATTTSAALTGLGIATSSAALNSSMASTASIWGLYAADQKYICRNGTAGTVASAVSANGILQLAVDSANNRAWVGVNNVWFDGSNGTTGNPSTGSNPTFTSLPSGLFVYVQTYFNTQHLNFGQRPFSYTPPSGYVALNAYNLPDSTIKQGNKVMDATLYTGNGSTQTITNAAGFKPDLVWYKCRSNTFDNSLFDSVRGATNWLVSNNTAVESALSGVTAFNSNGFSLGSNANGNTNAYTYVGWQWQAGQGSSSSNTSGTITSTVSVNASAGFSIATFTGTQANATVGHGLGIAPSLVIVRARTSVKQWMVWHSALSGTQYLHLDTTEAVASAATPWNSTVPTSSVFSLGADGTTNTSGASMLAYCWSEIAGYSKFGSYTGNGSTDGPFVYLGFKPKFILIKRTDTALYYWIVHDTVRNTYNLMDLDLYPNVSDAEGTSSGRGMDALSNGFKLRGTGGETNASGGTFIYAAFAENPFKNSLAR